jgi:hypothetical protein
MPAKFTDRIDDNEAASAPVGSLVGTGHMALAARSGSSHAFDVLVPVRIKSLPRSKEVARNTQTPSGAR